MSFFNAVLYGFCFTALLGLFCIVVPAYIQDFNSKRKEKNCAKKAGYENPSQNNSLEATAESQSVYRDCLYPNSY
jgi:hypothetical protein